jgi:hypothetical protein
MPESEPQRVILESGKILGYGCLFAPLVGSADSWVRKGWLDLGRGHAMPFFLVAASDLEHSASVGASLIFESKTRPPNPWQT